MTLNWTTLTVDEWAAMTVDEWAGMRISPPAVIPDSFDTLADMIARIPAWQSAVGISPVDPGDADKVATARAKIFFPLLEKKTVVPLLPCVVIRTPGEFGWESDSDGASLSGVYGGSYEVWVAAKSAHPSNIEQSALAFCDLFSQLIGGLADLSGVVGNNQAIMSIKQSSRPGPNTEVEEHSEGQWFSGAFIVSW